MLDPYRDLIRPLFFGLDPEQAHNLVLGALSQAGELFIRNPIHDSPGLGINLAGMYFPNRIGLAAGMDKAAEAVFAWQGMGFGFIELGTITYHPQPGNPSPRLFRLASQKSLLNRMGFNNLGAEAMVALLRNLRLSQKVNVPMGLNIGKSRIIPSDEIEAVIEDYWHSIQLLQPFADYLVINISSPNTPGLRDWQKPERIALLLESLSQSTNRPLFLKISPDIDQAGILDLIDIASGSRLAGLITTNTTIGRDGVPDWALRESGGISGLLLKKQARQITQFVAEHKPENLILISVGGIDSPEEAQLRLAMGADLVQVYTALIYEGPELITRINKALTDGLAST